jgi:parallel beta-helix repeat protein
MLSTKLTGALIALAVGGLAAAESASADVYIVRNTNSSGADSLRNRINDANNHAGHDTIGFRIPGPGPHTITPLNAPLPTITDPVTIDGYSEPGSTAPTATDPAVIQVAINATNHNVGLEIAADDSTIRGLSIHSTGVVAGQPGDAVRIVNGDGNRIEGNYLGLDETGAAAGNASDGVEIAGDDNVVGGSAAEDRNVISGNGFGGVSMLGDDNRVRGNSIGTDPDVTQDLGNDVGVWMFGTGNTVAGNILSGNEVGVTVASGTGNEVLDNLIGTNAKGDDVLVPGFFGGETGVEVDVAASDTDITGNLVGGVAGEGVLLAGDDNSVRDNRLGTDGVVELNSMRGVTITGDGNTVGGPAEDDGNLVSGNRLEGIELRADPVTDDPSEDNTVEGNLIGTGPAGDTVLANGDNGIEVIDANDNDIVDNVISGNDGNGVRIRVDDTTDADRNKLVGNAIGTDAGGVLDLGNGEAGVRIEEDADQNDVGGTNVADDGNTIAFNDEDGVAVDLGTANTILGNSMFANADLGIDLDDDGVTANDPGDVDTGSNELENVPELTGATTTSADWQIVDGLPGQFVRIDVYTCDDGEGRTFLGTVNSVINVSGAASGSVPLSTAPAVGDLVTATVTARRLVGGFPLNFVQDETSEFSSCVTVV